MRVFIVISIAFVLLIVFGVIYTQWETKKWVESLPNPPASVTSEKLEKTQRDPSVVVSDVAEDARQIPSENTHGGLSVERDSSVSETEDSSHEENPEVPTERNIGKQLNVYDWQADVDAHVAEHSHEGNPWKSAENRKVDGGGGQNITTEQLRIQLVDRFGDIPEVHTYVEMEQKIREKGSLTFDEMLRYAESMNYLFPSPSSEQTIKKLLQLLPAENRLGTPHK